MTSFPGRFFALLLVLSSAQPLVAGMELQPQDKNLAADRAEVDHFLDGLGATQASEANASIRSGYAALAHKPVRTLTTADFNKAGQDPLVAGHAVANAVIWSTVGAFAVGTSQQAIQAKFLETYGRAMGASTTSPEIAKAGALLSQQAKLVAQGDSVGAKAIARQFADIKVPGFNPQQALSSAQEAQVSDIQDVTGYDWGSTGLALGQSMLAGVMGFMQGGPWGAVVAVALSLGSSLMTGSFTAQTHSISSRNSGRNAGSATSWAGQAGAAIIGGQVGRGIQQRDTASKAGSAPLPVLQSPSRSADSVEIEATGGSARGSVLPEGKK